MLYSIATSPVIAAAIVKHLSTAAANSSRETIESLQSLQRQHDQKMEALENEADRRQRREFDEETRSRIAAIMNRSVIR